MSHLLFFISYCKGLGSTLSETRRWLRVLTAGETWCALCLSKITVAVVLKIDWEGAWVETWGPVRKLSLWSMRETVWRLTVEAVGGGQTLVTFEVCWHVGCGDAHERQSNGAAERWRQEHQGLIQGFCPEQLEGWISIKWDVKLLCKKLLKSSFSVFPFLTC